MNTMIPHKKNSLIGYLIILVASSLFFSACKFDEKSVIDGQTRRVGMKVKCSTPSDCTNPEESLCCLSANLLDTNKMFPDTLGEEERGFCAKSCDLLKTKISTPTKICTADTADKICAPGEKCSHLNSATPKPIGYCEKRCSSPSECDGETPSCCLSAKLVDNATKKFPDTLGEDQKGFCAASCQDVVGKVDNPIKVCTAATASTDCAQGESCVHINAASPTPIGYCEKRCFSAQECGSETPHCCLNADLLDVTKQKFPDTLTSDQKGYCAANCQDVAKKLNDNPIKVCTAATAATDCTQGESCTHINDGTPAIGYCERRCISPEQCEPEAPKCCLSGDLLHGGKRFPDTISEDQKGYCASSCEDVKGVLSNPVEVCSQSTESAICRTHSTQKVCTYLNHVNKTSAERASETIIGQCVQKDQIKCESDRDCPLPGSYCLIHGADKYAYAGKAEGTCQNRAQPRDICLFRESKMSLLNQGINVNAIGNARSATPYCYPSRLDYPSPGGQHTENINVNVPGSPSPYGRVAFLCTRNDQCKEVGSNYVCYGTEIRGTGFSDKPLGVGFCQPDPSVSCGTPTDRGDDVCGKQGLTCCRACPNPGTPDCDGGLSWYCVDTTVTQGNCYPFDLSRNPKYAQANHFGACNSGTGYPCNEISRGVHCEYVKGVIYNTYLCQ